VVKKMICKSLNTVAMICLLAAFVPVSAGTASEEVVADQSALSGADDVTTVDELDEMTNGSSSYSTNQSSNESSNESSARNMTVIDLSTLDDVTETEESPNITVISYTTPSVIEEVGAEEVSPEVTDVKALSETLGSGSEVAEDALNLSTIENGSAEAVSSETTMISYTIPSSNGSGGEEPVDVRVLGNVLEPSPSSSVTNLSTLGGEYFADNETETGYTSLSSTNESEVTDVKTLSEILGY
jgi:hypothetical protein